MKTRNILLAISAAGLAIPVSYASTGQTFVGGEVGFATHAAGSPLTREQVLNELAAFRANPVLSDGVVVVGGEIGYIDAGPGRKAAPHSHARGLASHTHVLGNAGAASTPAAAVQATESERRAMREQYLN